MKYLVTGAAGFIGFHVSKKLLEMGHKVIGLDNLNSYYDPKLKCERVAILKQNTKFEFVKIDICVYEDLINLFKKHEFEAVVHLAAQAGVQYSLQEPFLYERTNVLGFLNVLEVMRVNGVKNLVYASSSSVYGKNDVQPFNEKQLTVTPVSLYAATKLTNELFAHVYRDNFGINTVGLRFFSVYGPWGRPDMAYFLFTDAIVNKKPINIYGKGEMKRDFTYIDDIVGGVVGAVDKCESLSGEVINLGNSEPVSVLELVRIIENELGIKSIKKMLPKRVGDVDETCADIGKAKRVLGYQPNVDLKKGLSKFVNWYKNYCGLIH